jgi:hypothetical protein
MKPLSIAVIPLFVVSCLVFAGCGSSPPVVHTKDSCGQQMTDLQDALASGAMTKSEYDRARKVALKDCNKAH